MGAGAAMSAAVFRAASSHTSILRADYTILYYTILYYTILYYTILYYTILYYTILYYTILFPNFFGCPISQEVLALRVAAQLRGSTVAAAAAGAGLEVYCTIFECYTPVSYYSIWRYSVFRMIPNATA